MQEEPFHIYVRYFYLSNSCKEDNIFSVFSVSFFTVGVLLSSDIDYVLVFSLSSDIDYVFGVYCGILLASTFYTFVYSAIQCNRPKLYPKTVIPGIISGIMWGIAMRECAPRLG